jgi:tRNA (mo5U34)-methyltransferase
LRGSKVKKEICSVYEVTPERFGVFDMVFCSDLLVHLRDPLRAMEAIWRVTGGFAVFADVYDPALEGLREWTLANFTHKGNNETWWQPSTACYLRWLQLARFSRVEEKARFKLQSNFQDEVPKVVFHAYR